ncbi:VOC family protein [Arthrobacter sp. UCD-GKA]|uniref:VOC family protein n=1 Tax=Arthrobacter sp. UCD-GKA TaxID=1913576 RepID=UPI0009F21194|nr:VOC family protein [Arthrobacter sp. UCD-GKA]
MPMEPTTTAATGKHTTNGVPHGYTALTPFIVVEPAQAAIEFYREVFGATVLSVMPGAPKEDGSPTVSHAELDFGNGILQLSDPQPGYGLVAADAQHTNNSLAVYVQDVDAVFARALERGATAVEQPADFVSGDRFATFVDAFGRRWNVMTRVEDLSREESERRVTAWLETFNATGTA